MPLFGFSNLSWNSESWSDSGPVLVDVVAEADRQAHPLGPADVAGGGGHRVLRLVAGPRVPGDQDGELALAVGVFGEGEGVGGARGAGARRGGRGRLRAGGAVRRAPRRPPRRPAASAGSRTAGRAPSSASAAPRPPRPSRPAATGSRSCPPAAGSVRLHTCLVSLTGARGGGDELMNEEWMYEDSGASWCRNVRPPVPSAGVPGPRAPAVQMPSRGRFARRRRVRPRRRAYRRWKTGTTGPARRL